MLSLATLTIISLVIIATAFAVMLNDRKADRLVTYEELSASFMSTNANEHSLPTKSLSSSPIVMPANVLQAFTSSKGTLDDWLDEMDDADQARFLENLSAVITKAEKTGVSRSNMPRVTQRFKQLWDRKAAREQSRQLEHRLVTASFVSSGFALLLILTLLSIGLVLFAIERNTRPTV